MMELYFKSSGGFANLMTEGMLDLADLPADLMHRVEEVLVTGHGLAADAEGTRSLPGLEGVDTMHYHLELTTETGVRTFEIDEADAPPEVLELVDELMFQLNSRRMRERGGGAGDGGAASGEPTGASTAGEE